MYKLKKSTFLTQNLKEACEILKLEHFKPQLDVKTRWNSTLYMLQKYLKMAEPLEFIAIKESKIRELLLQPGEKVELKYLIQLLEHLEYSTTILCSTQTPRITDVNLIYKALEAVLEEYCSNGPSERVKTVAFHMHDQMKKVS